MAVDYKEMAEQAERLIERLDPAVSVHVRAPGGTDITIDLSGRRFLTDTRLSPTDRGCNLPCGAVYGAPVETGADGVGVADGSIGGEGVPPSPVELDVRSGRVTAVRCRNAEWQARITQLLDTDEGARTIAEVGIGLNPKARLIGIMLEGEKATRTAHIAFGSNAGMPGGINPSTLHVDYLVHRPTIVARYEDGSERTLLDDGSCCA